MGSEIEEILKQLANIDRRAAVWCAARCARAMLHFVPEEEQRPRRAIELAEGWARGEVTVEECAAASRAAMAAAPLAVARGASRVFRDPHLVPRSTAEAVRDGIRAVHLPPSVTAEWRHRAVGSRPRAVRDAIARAHADSVPAQREASDLQLTTLLALASAERWPLTTPAPEQLRAAPEAVAVAWDLVAAATGDHTMLELLEAHARAVRLGLDWEDPVQRAVAERATDEERVRQVLAAKEPP